MEIKTILTILLGIIFTSNCFANIDISPSTVKLSKKQPTASIYIRNTSTESIEFKSDMAEKVKKRGGTIYVENKVVLVTPRTIKIKPGGRKRVRFTLSKKSRRHFTLSKKTRKPALYYLTLLHKTKPKAISLIKRKINSNIKTEPNVKYEIPVIVSQ